MGTMIGLRQVIGVLVVGITVVLGLLVGATPAEAATIHVTSLSDSGGDCSTPSASNCTLRAAVAAASTSAPAPGDTIQIDVSGTILLGSVLTLDRHLSIVGPTSGSIALDGQEASTVIRVTGKQVALTGLTIQNGRTTQSGAVSAAGILNDGGTLTLTNSTLTKNRRVFTGSSDEFLIIARGGAINNTGGTLTIVNSTLHDNSIELTATRDPNAPGGGTILLVLGAGIFTTNGTVTVRNSTLSGNANIGTMSSDFRSRGTAIHNEGGGAVTVISSTIYGNVARDTFSGALGRGGAVYANANAVTLRNTIVGNSTALENCAVAGGTITSLGNNLSDDQSCGFNAARGDISASDLGLAALALNAPGSTMTHALQPGSPAINGVTFDPTDCGTTVATDQRGVSRPQPRPDSRCDIGAFEAPPVNPPTFGPLGNQKTSEDTLAKFSVTVDDVGTPVQSLKVTARSSNTGLVPDDGITIAANGSVRTISVQPAANQSGDTQLTLNVDDGEQATEKTITLTVTPVNDPPVNTVPGAQRAQQNTPLIFSAVNGNQISIADIDAFASPVRVVVTATSGTITPNGGSASSALTFVAPLATVNDALNGLVFTATPGYRGPASIQIVTDDQAATGNGGALSDTDTIAITVDGAHAAPTISAIPDQATGQDGATPTVPFSVSSTEVAASALIVTARSSNQALVPDTGIQILGSGAARAIRVQADPRQSGEATVDVKVADGTAEAHATFKVAVVRVNAVPAAVNDAYTVGATQTLTVPAATGVLKNDADPDGAGLQARLVAGPAHGGLDLRLDGSFTYRPAAGYAGPDSFTYRAAGGATTSSPATVTLTVTPSACAPRATVRVTTSTSGGKLQAAVEALPLDAGTNNSLREIQFGEPQNGRVTLNGQPITRGIPYTPPASTTRVVFTVERLTAGQATTIPITVVDGCGAWPSFVGGGADAGF